MYCSSLPKHLPVPALLLVVAALALAQEQQTIVLDLDYDNIEPQVETREYENRRVEEYRVNDNLYAIKIRPKNGEPYYLIDPDGSGQMEWRRDTNENIRVPNWSLIKW
jgi:hypothetical protein